MQKLKEGEVLASALQLKAINTRKATMLLLKAAKLELIRGELIQISFKHGY